MMLKPDHFGAGLAGRRATEGVGPCHDAVLQIDSVVLETTGDPAATATDLTGAAEPRQERCHVGNDFQSANAIHGGSVLHEERNRCDL